MRKKKALTVVCLLVVTALSLMGLGYAKWSDSVAIKATAQTGTLRWGFVPYSFMEKDVGPDWTTEMNGGMNNVAPAPEGKDVGSTTGDLIDSNGDGVLDTLNVTVNQAYPCYYNEISAKVVNSGTIPVVIQYPVLNWMGKSQVIEDGADYLLTKDGSILKYVGQDPAQVGAVIEFRWMDNAGRQQHPGVKLEESGEFHLLQPADQNHQYTFSLTIEAIQWNESPLRPV